MDCHSLLQGIFPTEGWNLFLLSPPLAGRFFLVPPGNIHSHGGREEAVGTTQPDGEAHLRGTAQQSDGLLRPQAVGQEVGHHRTV